MSPADQDEVILDDEAAVRARVVAIAKLWGKKVTPERVDMVVQRAQQILREARKERDQKK